MLKKDVYESVDHESIKVGDVVDVSFTIGSFCGLSNKVGIFLQLLGVTLIESAENIKAASILEQNKRASSPITSSRVKLTKF
jgi:hypothetical protein